MYKIIASVLLIVTSIQWVLISYLIQHQHENEIAAYKKEHQELSSQLLTRHNQILQTKEPLPLMTPTNWEGVAGKFSFRPAKV